MGLFGKILKTGFDIVTAPVAIVQDVVTGCGLATDADESYTVKKAKRLVKDLDEVSDAIEEL